MAPHGFNAYALGVLATRSLSLVLNPPQALRFVLLRKIFWPWGDEHATDLRLMRIPSGCLPADALDAVQDAADDRFATSDHLAISNLHKVMLCGPPEVFWYTQGGMKRHLRTLVAAGLCASSADARRWCMLQSALLNAHVLSWYLERKAAVLEAGGTLDDARTACCRNGGMQKALPCMLLWQQSKCAPPNSTACFGHPDPGLLPCDFAHGTNVPHQCLRGSS